VREKPWRTQAREVLVGLRIERGDDPEEAKAKVFQAYPFGTRDYTPYKVWCEEKLRIYWWLYPTKQKPAPEWLRGGRGE